MEVRTATVADTEAVISVLAESFFDDPMLRWAFADRSTRLRRLEALWRFVAGGVYLPGGASTVGVENGEIVAAALWRRPNDLTRSEEYFAEHGEAFYTALDGDLERLSAVTAAMSAHHPTDPHWYLLAVGVSPHLQGGGRGGRLLEHTLDTLDTLDTGDTGDAGDHPGDHPGGDRPVGAAYLEATSPRSRLLYRRLGFIDISTVDIGADGVDGLTETTGFDEAPTIWTMWRPARSTEPTS